MYPSEANASAPRLNRDVATASAVASRPTGSIANLRAGERANLAATLNADPKFKKYTTQVDRCLQTFDNVHEWADFIAFLTKLLKTFQSYMQFKEIPRKLIVAKRLSQCLNPALPTGVHQRALDVYAHILAVLGSEGLKRDLQLWSAGLFPFFEYAATSVKPTLINLFETHYLPLQEGLRPIMKAFILSLLPGLEEEMGEFFDKVLSLLDRLSGTVSPAFFFQNLWLIMLTTPSGRGTALNFLTRRLPKLNGDEDIAPIIGRDTGLMIRAFAAALEDDNLLVRRGALDLLVQTLPIDSGALKRVQKDDQRILMKAAINVVLRRELALNRRLYAWLLGPGADDAPGKVEFFRTHALELVRETLREDMFAPHPDSLPFKIFISLLDKWELGGPLTDVLLFDAMKAVKRGATQEGEASGDLLLTANMLYEAVEPTAVWKQLFTAIRIELLNNTASTSVSRFEAMSMVKFILTRFKMQEQDVQDVHLPLFFAALLELLKTLVTAVPCRISQETVHEVLRLLTEAAQHIPSTALTRPFYQSQSTPEGRSSTTPYAHACNFYGITTVQDGVVELPRSVIPFITAFEDLVALSTMYAQMITDGSVSNDDQRTQYALKSFVEILTLLLGLVERLGEKRSDALEITWEPNGWLTAVLATLEKRSSFVIIDRVVSTVVALGSLPSIRPHLVIDERMIMFQMVNTLFFFLRVNYAPYHMRAVRLVWMLETATTHHHIESIIAQSLTSPESRNVQEAYEAFGVLWRLTDDSLLPGFRFKIPMLIVLDTLKNHDPSFRRIGETWMRCSVKSYTRVLEPILYDLLDPSILRLPSASTYSGREIIGYTYERRFDQHRMEHLLETLLSLAKFGGQGFGRTARGTHYKKSIHRELVERVEAAKLVPPESTYMDVLLEVLLRFLQSEPPDTLIPFMGHANAQIQADAVDLIQNIVSRGELDAPGLQAVEAIVVGKLYSSVHLGRVDLQNKLLHVLHSVISASSALASDSHRTKAGSSKLSEANGLVDEAPIPEDVGKSSFIYVNPLLGQTLIDGITKAAGRPILQHWLDFVAMTVAQFSRALSYMVSPLSDCICRQIRHALLDIKKVLDCESAKRGSITSGTTDAEFIMLLNTLERLVLLGLTKTHDSTLSEEETTVDRSTHESSGGLLGIVSNVFGSESTSNLAEEFLSARSPGYRALHDAVRALYNLWEITGNVVDGAQIPEAETLSLIFSRARTRGRRVLERLFRVQSSEVMESIVECWYRGASENDSSIAFEIVDILTASAQTVVHMLCESISYRIAASDRAKKPAVNPNLSDGVIFTFLEEYLARLEGPLVVQVWGRCIALAKDITSNVHGYKQQLFPTLRCITVLADKITQTTAIEDRRTRKELQDNFIKLVDNSILIAGRSFDQGNWIRRSTIRDAATATNGNASPLRRAPSDPALDEKAAAPSVEGSTLSMDLTDQINVFLASRVLPNLRRFLFDNDKVAGVCNNLVYYIITPAMKIKSGRTLDIDDSILETLRELSKIPPGAKAWRGLVSEAFGDNRFFNSTPHNSRKWQPIIRAFIDTDKQAFPELLGKITSAGSANIFANREYETLLRSLNLRRLSYVLFAAEKNHFLTQLPSIQEKLVDILRNPNSPMMQSEVYLCLRVLLCRLSPYNLTSFWPVILTELIRIFEQIIMEPPPDNSEELQVILSASKFLDLVLTLQTEEFQIHQWIFVTDTVDAIYRPDAWFPEALLDQLAEIISDLPATNTRESKVMDVDPTPLTQYGKLDSAISYSDAPRAAMRQPLLTSVRQIASIRDLVPFFSHVSIASYEGVYHCAGNVDWDAIEEGLLGEMFESK